MKSLHNVPAPAKLNLFLHVTGQRSDGYHLLQSVFMLLDWWDLLHFDVRLDGQLQRIDLSTPLPADDLCMQAARALKDASGTALGAVIQVDKRLPAQAGLGGGSSDAATCLLALNRLWGLHWPLSRLHPLAVKLGADVPFFLRDESLNAAFLSGAQARGLLQLKGHKSVGGMRASIYNAMPLAGVQALVEYMQDFEKTQA